MKTNIKWLGHASFLFQGSKTIYSDPWDLKSDEPKGDVVLITHAHYDHCVPEDVKKIAKKDTVIIAPPDCEAKLSNIANFKPMRAGDKVQVAGIEIEAVPAYNSNKQFHPKGNGWLGYIFTLDGERIYQAGDTDLIPEMKNIHADVVLLPVGGTYTMTAKESATAVEWIKPKVAIPMHWGKIVGTNEDAEEFKRLCGCEVKILC